MFLYYVFPSMCCTDISSQLAQQAVQTLCAIAKKDTNFTAPCMETLLGLLSLQLDHVSSEVLVVFQGKRFEMQNCKYCYWTRIGTLQHAHQ